MSEEVYHIPALLPQTIDGLDISSEGIYVDVTLGGGGHSRAIAERLTPPGHLYSLDRDSDAIARVEPTSVFTPIHGNFRYLDNYMRYYGVDGKVSGILGDLGVSFHHFDDASRGFSFRSDAPLDMRMNQNASISAAQLLAESDERTLTTLFRSYADLKNPTKTSRAIIEAKNNGGLQTTMQLADAIRPTLNPKAEKKEMAQVFQALRIAVNSEMDALCELLTAAPQVLKEEGRAVILTYHSVEDRIVKNFFRSGNAEGKIEKDFYGRVFCDWTPVTRSPITADEEEVALNPRSRSAKLRAASYTPVK